MSLRAAVAGLATLLVACSDGYPSADAPRLQPRLMSAGELVDALNELGARRHLEQRWRYKLLADCRLEVSVQHGLRRRSVEQVLLSGADVRVQFDPDARVYDVRVQPSVEETADESGVSALKTTRWSDNVQVQSLLQHLVQACDADTGPS